MDIKIRNILDHGWDISSVVYPLSLFRMIDQLVPKKLEESDMSVFRLSAWTVNPDAIPRSSKLLFAGPMSFSTLTQTASTTST